MQPVHCSPSAFGLLLHRNRSLALLSLLFLWASKSDVRHFAPPLNPPRGFKPFPAPLAYSCIAALPASGGSLGREPLERAARALQPQRLWPTPASQPQPCPLIGSRPCYPFLNVSFPSPWMPFSSFLSFIHFAFLYPSLAFPFTFPFPCTCT